MKHKEYIRNPQRASQVIDFGGILPGTLCPTDLDGILEWRNRAYIIIEVKYMDKQPSEGQRTAMERMVKDFYRSGKRAVAIIVEHDVHDTQKSVYAARKPVRAVYFDTEQRWRRPRIRCDTRQFILGYIDWLDKKQGKDSFGLKIKR